MRFNFKTLIILVGVATVVIGLSATYINSAKLVNDFEKNVENKQFVPEANAIELSEIDAKTHRSWKIKAEKSIGNSELSEVTSEKVEAQIFDEKDNLKILINAPKATANRSTETSILHGPADITMVEKNTKIIANKFILKKGQPFEAVGNVKILLSPDGSRQINAAKAVISQAMDDIVLYNVSQSPVAPNLLIRGGVLRMEHAGQGKGAKPSKIILTNGAWVKSGETICQSARLDVPLDAAGNPSVAVFTGAPVATQKGTRIHANRIEYVVKTSQVKANGNVRTEII